MQTAKLVKLNLGCGMQPLPGWVNCDLHPNQGVDVVMDLQQPWPFKNNSVISAFCSHVLEHLPNYKAFFDELWRVLHPQGQILIRVPDGAHDLAWVDLTHVRPWHAASFCFLQPGYDTHIGNLQASRGNDHYFMVHLIQKIISPPWCTFFRLIPRKWVPFLVEHFKNISAELWIYLSPLKTQASIESFKAIRMANVVPLDFAYWKDGHIASIHETAIHFGLPVKSSIEHVHV